MIKLAYIAAPSYSGSTLLTFLLNAHPRIATVGELKWGSIDLTTYRCSCGALLTACDFWRQLRERVEAEGLTFDLQRPPTEFRTHTGGLTDRIVRARNRGPLFEGVRGAMMAVIPACQDLIATARATNRTAINAALDLQRAEIFLDGSKDPVRLQHLLNTGDYDVRLIHLVRDGRGVVNSTIGKKGLSPTIAAEDWRRTHEQIERLAQRLDANQYQCVSYESLCDQTEDTLRELAAFLEIDATEFADDISAATHHILGNRMRLSRLDEIALDEKWHTELDANALAAFEKCAGALNRRYGYQ